LRKYAKMPEGLFSPNQLPVPGLSTDRLCAAMVSILPRTVLMLDWATSAEGDGPRHALEYGYLNRVHVSTKRMIAALGL